MYGGRCPQLFLTWQWGRVSAEERQGTQVDRTCHRHHRHHHHHVQIQIVFWRLEDMYKVRHLVTWYLVVAAFIILNGIIVWSGFKHLQSVSACPACVGDHLK